MLAKFYSAANLKFVWNIIWMLLQIIAWILVLKCFWDFYVGYCFQNSKVRYIYI